MKHVLLECAATAPLRADSCYAPLAAALAHGRHTPVNVHAETAKLLAIATKAHPWSLLLAFNRMSDLHEPIPRGAALLAWAEA